MELKTKRYTAEEFDEFVLLPENVQRNFELIGGEIVEKMVSNSYCSIIESRINRLLGNFVEEHDLGWITSPDGGYNVAGERYIPDVAFLSRKRHPEVPKVSYIRMAPDLAVEVMSPNDSERELLLKVTTYLLDNVVVWVVYPDDKIVHIHTPGKVAEVLNINDKIDGGTLLPGFTLPVEDIFPKDSAPEEN